MKKLILILIAALALVGCGSNPIANTQWEVIPNTLDDISLISFEDDKCTFYVKSSLNGKTSTIQLKYDVNDNVVTFSPIDVQMSTYPILTIDKDFLIFNNQPTFKKVEK